MNLGIFDSGVGGLLIARSIKEAMPDLNFIYFGDTLHVPYGSRSTEAIYKYCVAAVEFLFRKGCPLVIFACNTASAAALRRIQQEYLPERYPERRVLGVVVPTLETAVAAKFKKIGLIATNYIIQSNIYGLELQKIDPQVEIFPMACPLLVPLIENHGEPWLDSVLESYLLPLKEKGIDSLILGCTHYIYLKERAKKMAGPEIAVLSQDEIIPQKLADYLVRHPELSSQIGRDGREQFYLSDITDTYRMASDKIYGRKVAFERFQEVF